MKFEIEIQLREACGAAYVGQMPYYRSGGRTDAVCFERGRIVIEAERKHRFTEDDVFMNLQHSLYNQLVKVLLVHYCQAGSHAGITRITVSEVKGAGAQTLFSRSFGAGAFPQPFCAFDAPVAFDFAALLGALGEDDDAYRLRIVLLHWLGQGRYLDRPGQAGDRQRRMEIVWRTFERLCEYHLHEPLDKRFIVNTGLNAMITEVMTHSAAYPQAAAAVAAETADTLRVFRWQEMIRNNYPETPGARNTYARNYNEYKAQLIDPFFDERAVQLMLDVLPYRRSELQRYGLYTTIENSLQAKVAMHQRRDMDVVALLLQYIYFLRNRLFHGQLLLRVSVFDDANTDHMRLDFLTNLLATLAVELINNRSAL